MGLLDDAIREHLELKRLRGADPGAVAREEHDALGPVRREEEADLDLAEDNERVPLDVSKAVFLDSDSTPGSDPSGVSQRTIEINMEAELAAELGSADGHPTPPTRTSAAPHPEHSASTEESFEWEAPRDRSGGGSAPGAGADEETTSRTEDDEHVVDVLEETPDFRRDTPELERLWFEQRPPRDFDFNE